MLENIIPIAIIIIALALVLWLIFSIVHVGREYERLGVFFFGRLQGAQGPGLVLLIPIIQQAVKADLREFFLEVPRQTCITKDNAPIDIDCLVFSKVFQRATSVV